MQIIQRGVDQYQTYHQQDAGGDNEGVFIPGGLAFKFLDEVLYLLAAVFALKGQSVPQCTVLFFVQSLDRRRDEFVFPGRGGR